MLTSEEREGLRGGWDPSGLGLPLDSSSELSLLKVCSAL